MDDDVLSRDRQKMAKKVISNKNMLNSYGRLWINCILGSKLGNNPKLRERMHGSWGSQQQNHQEDHSCYLSVTVFTDNNFFFYYKFLSFVRKKKSSDVPDILNKKAVLRIIVSLHRILPWLSRMLLRTKFPHLGQ